MMDENSSDGASDVGDGTERGDRIVHDGPTLHDNQAQRNVADVHSDGGESSDGGGTSDGGENGGENDGGEDSDADEDGNVLPDIFGDENIDDPFENLQFLRDEQLYNGARITVGQSMLLILALMLHHSLEMSCVESIITVLQFHCLADGLRKNSIYKFKKFFNLVGGPNAIKHYFCYSCHKKLQSENEVCPSCPRKKNPYFIELSLADQLKSMYARADFYDLLQFRFTRPHRPGIISDIYDGTLYQTHFRSGFLANPNNISFTWYTDGIPIFKSSKISMWPVYLTINELPFKHRKKRQNTLLLGIWYGDQKPSMNTFIYQFRPQLEQIFNDGINVTLPDNERITVRGIVLSGTCDLPAKCNCLNFIQFNGKNGCPDCVILGEEFKISDKKTVHVYPYTNNIHFRTSQDCIDDAESATPENPINGVKGHTAFSRIMPDFIAGMGIDRMHSVDGGVAKKLLKLFFEHDYRDFPFSLHHVTDLINSRLKNIKPPKFVHRMPRTVHDLIHWKASELKMFFFYYSIPVFEGIMRQDYFENYLRLVSAVVILSSDEITEFDLITADNLLHRFVREFQIMYGLRFCSITIHSLLHLADCVRRLGPLWVYICYEYEDINGQLLKTIHGTGHIDTQVANSHYRFINMIQLLEQVPEGDIRTFCLTTKKQVKIIEEIFCHCYSVGTYKTLHLIPEVILTGLGNIGMIANNYQILQYFRLLKDKKLYVSDMYRRQLQTQSSVVLYYDERRQTNRLGLIHSFIKVINCNCVREGECNCAINHFAIIYEFEARSTFVAEGDGVRLSCANFLYKCIRTENLTAVTVRNIIKVCVYMNIDDQIYVALPINDKELE